MEKVLIKINAHEQEFLVDDIFADDKIEYEVLYDGLGKIQKGFAMYIAAGSIISSDTTPVLAFIQTHGGQEAIGHNVFDLEIVEKNIRCFGCQAYSISPNHIAFLILKMPGRNLDLCQQHNAKYRKELETHFKKQFSKRMFETIEAK